MYKRYEVNVLLYLTYDSFLLDKYNLEEGVGYKVVEVVRTEEEEITLGIIIDAKSYGKLYIDLDELDKMEDTEGGVLTTSDKEFEESYFLEKGDFVQVLEPFKLKRGFMFDIGGLYEVSLVGSDGTIYLKNKFQEFIEVYSCERAYIAKACEITETSSNIKRVEEGDYLIVKEPDNIIAGYDLTKDKVYKVVDTSENNAVYVIDDDGDTLYLTGIEVNNYCDLIKSNEDVEGEKEIVAKDCVHARIRAEDVKKIKVLKPKRIVRAHNLTEGKEYEVIGKFTEEGCYIKDDEGVVFHLSPFEIEDYCEIVREGKSEADTGENKEKRESTMLKVNVDTSEECVEDKWVKGNILSNEEGSLVIMVIETKYATGVKTEVIPLIDTEFHRGTFRLDTSNKEFWLEKCPILVKDASLNINIRKEVAN